jgi:hypothetical protein
MAIESAGTPVRSAESSSGADAIDHSAICVCCSGSGSTLHCMPARVALGVQGVSPPCAEA